MISPLELSLLEKISAENGWELCQMLPNGCLNLSSVRHEAVIELSRMEGDYPYSLHMESPVLRDEISVGLGQLVEVSAAGLMVSNLDSLATVLRRAAELAIALPETPLQAFQAEMRELESSAHAQLTTERMAEVRQRVGQNYYRQALMGYWQGACAVTGINVPEVLRASHAKPWADCGTDAERLSVFNGFLLCANLDALFDRGLISFDDFGEILVSKRLDVLQLQALGLHGQSRLRSVSASHMPFMQWHRDCVFQGS
jgi:hypothetical protein